MFAKKKCVIIPYNYLSSQELEEIDESADYKKIESKNWRAGDLFDKTNYGGEG